MMKNLDLSREEAIQLLQDDEDDVSVDLTPEQKKVVKKMTQGDRKKETAPRKRERKVDANKAEVFGWVKTMLEGMELNGKVENMTCKNEAEISFTYNGADYSVKLTKHRAKKA